MRYDDLNHRKFKLPKQKNASPEKRISDKGTTQLDGFASYLLTDDNMENDFIVTLELDSDDVK